MLLAKALQLLYVARLEELADLGGRALADALDLDQLLRREPSEVRRLGSDGLRRALVRANAERLRVTLLEHRELGELAEHVEDVLLRVGHGP